MRHGIKLAILTSCLVLAGCRHDPTVTRDRYFRSAEKYLKEGSFQEAVIQYRNAIRADNSHVPSYLGLARALQGTGDHQNAAAAFQQVLKIDAKNIPAKLELGRYTLALGATNPEMFKRAREAAEEVLQEDPNKLEARILLGNAYAGLNDLENSIREMEKVLSADPLNLTASISLGALEFRQNSPEQAEAIFKDAVNKHPDSIQAHLALASFYVAAKRPQEAEPHLRKAFDLAPSEPAPLYSLASFYAATNRDGEAEKVFKDAIARKPKEREPIWGLAGFYLQRGRQEEGLKALQDLLQKNPTDRVVGLRVADVYISLNHRDEAEKTVGLLLASNKDDPEAHFLMGRLAFIRNESEKALEEVNTAIKLKDSLIPARMLRANLLMAQGDLEGTLAELKEVLQRDRGNILARAVNAKVLALQRKPQDALGEADEVLKLAPNNEDALMARAEAFLLLRNFAEARRGFQQLSQLRPDNALYWQRLGMCGAVQGDMASAIASLRKALEVRSDLASAIDALVSIHMRMKRPDEAIAELDRLEKAGSPKDLVHIFRGRIMLTGGNLSGAEAEFHKAVESNPKNYQAYLLLGQLNMQQKNVRQSIREMDQLIAQDAKFVPAHLLKGYYLQSSGDVQGAMASYRKTLELDPANASAANNLAWLLAENGTDFQEALSWAQIAKKKAPEDGDVADTLGWIRYKLKNYVMAVDQLQFAVNSGATKAVNYYHLGLAYQAKGDRTLAQEALRKALELDPSFPGADEARKALQAAK